MVLFTAKFGYGSAHSSGSVVGSGSTDEANSKEDPNPGDSYSGFFSHDDDCGSESRKKRIHNTSNFRAKKAIELPPCLAALSSSLEVALTSRSSARTSCFIVISSATPQNCIDHLRRKRKLKVHQVPDIRVFQVGIFLATFVYGSNEAQMCIYNVIPLVTYKL